MPKMALIRVSIVLHRLIKGNVKNLQMGHLYDLFVCFVALRPKSTAMVMAGRSVHLTTLLSGQA